MGIFDKIKELFSVKKTLELKQFELTNLNSEIDITNNKVAILKEKIDIEEKKLEEKNNLIAEKEKTLLLYKEEAKNEILDELEKIEHDIEIAKIEKKSLEDDKEKLTKEINRYSNQARKYKSELVGLKKFKKIYPENTDLFTQADNGYYVRPSALEDADEFLKKDSLLDNVVRLHLHTDNSKELKKLAVATQKEIDTLLDNFKTNYTTKANETIYELMVISLQAEIQNLLFTLSFNNLDTSKKLLTIIFDKYLAIASNGNRSILPTITRFLTQLQPLYSELLTIEYKHYIYKQQEKEEQRQLREQAKQDKEEQKALEDERKKLEFEESKFQSEIERNLELLNTETNPEMVNQLAARIKELEQQMLNIEEKKEVIASLSHGKAGYVYVISNKGAFGERMFKVGMTRRSTPLDRINELSGASVPFKFDVHALVFSDDAVTLENSLHNKLSNQRVNKVNYRKEFFEANIDDLEIFIGEIDPTAEFDARMVAEEYNQSLFLAEDTDGIEKMI